MTRHWCPCGKATYPTRGKAEAAIAGIKRYGEKRAKTPERAYPCPAGGDGWHLTSTGGTSEGDDRFGRRKGRAMRAKGGRR